jgi:hypothetical protein
VAGGVGNDELALGRGEVAVGDVDGDALLALSLEAVEQEGIVDLAVAGVADLFAIGVQGAELIFSCWSKNWSMSMVLFLIISDCRFLISDLWVCDGL